MKEESKKVTAKRLLKAIYAHCLECCGDDRRELRACVLSDCPLWPYRLGKRALIERLPETEKEKETETAESRKAKTGDFLLKKADNNYLEIETNSGEKKYCGVEQEGSSPASYAGGRWFKSSPRN